MLTTTRNERIDNYSPTDNPQLTGKISTELYNVGAVDQRISRRDRVKPVGMARGRRGNWYRRPHQHNAVKVPWPNAFADGDVEKWIRDFALIASCNGIKGSAHLVTALGALLSGRARAAYDLNLESNQALNYENLKAFLKVFKGG
ncbi:unnamed protein product [Echinostoma caproni]|uniref:Integrase n=1 Tax=Echinostoma caproni TaxID=27848 RepID=A0A183AZ10_9TREM|nr:unnamed protein product [Echinostoma caproni]